MNTRPLPRPGPDWPGVVPATPTDPASVRASLEARARQHEHASEVWTSTAVRHAAVPTVAVEARTIALSHATIAAALRRLATLGPERVSALLV